MTSRAPPTSAPSEETRPPIRSCGRTKRSCAAASPSTTGQEPAPVAGRHLGPPVGLDEAAELYAAEAHFATALEQAETLPHRPEQAHTRRFYAAMLLRRASAGDREQARRLLAEAEALYRDMGMPKHVAMAQALCRGDS